MNQENEKDLSVYEIGYLIVSSIPEEKVPEAADEVKKIITDAGANIIAEEAPARQQLAYTIRRKTVSGAYEKYDTAYFGWIKFDLSSDLIEKIKKNIVIHPVVLRMLLITTIRENTYLGKRATAVLVKADAEQIDKVEDRKVVAPATIEEMDKSIDDMVKEA